MRESVQEERTRLLLESQGVAYRKDGRQGWPDRIALVGGGHHCWVEHKSPRGRLTPAQRRVFPKLEAAGDLVIYAREMTAAGIAREVMRFCYERRLGVQYSVTVHGPSWFCCGRAWTDRDRRCGRCGKDYPA